MPLGDNNGSTYAETGKLYDDDGTTTRQIGEVYDNDGTSSRLIYKAEETHTITYTHTQDNTWGHKQVQNTGGFYYVTFTAFSRGTSYGETYTRVEIIRDGTMVQRLADVYSAYTGSGQNQGGTNLQLNKAIAIQPGDYIRLAMCADFNPDVSGQHDSTCSVTFTFS